MHVLQITPRYFPNIGGVEVVVQKISEMLVANGIQVTVYSVDLIHDLLRQQKVNEVLVKRFTPVFGDPLYLPEPKFLRSLLRENVDIIHVHNVHTLLPLFAALFKHKKTRLVVQSHYHRFGQSTLRHFLLKLYRRALSGLVFSRADVVVVNSIYEKEILCEDFKECKNVLLVPEGVDVDEVKRIKHDPVKPRRILYVGALKGYKNVDKILESFARLIGRVDTEFKLVIVGRGSEYDFLVNRARELNISSLVEWKRDLSRQQLLVEYAEASTLVLLSPLESFSRVVYEALMIGLPVVVLNYGATAYLARNGFAEGVDSLDPEEIADAIIRATNRTHPRISDGPSSFLSWEAYSNQIISIYCRL
ncbi:MAG: glycosyltransferase family 4 protein [Candidatus Bathyarchaeota archaeon]|nr:glycosyltransferase family 4 protein [Candidatus Bathyarchaeota archaeon]MDH5787817.1 glycosyltransferase family 4 protein [Candidatus Bathyarchaeota archaeon]